MIAVKPLFQPGRVVATPAALEALEQAGQSVWIFLARHLAGDWGAVDARQSRQRRSLEGRLAASVVLPPQHRQDDLAYHRGRGRQGQTGGDNRAAARRLLEQPNPCEGNTIPTQ